MLSDDFVFMYGLCVGWFVFVKWGEVMGFFGC